MEGEMEKGRHQGCTRRAGRPRLAPRREGASGGGGAGVEAARCHRDGRCARAPANARGWGGGGGKTGPSAAGAALARDVTAARARHSRRAQLGTAESTPKTV